jgi:hypothetical protein
MGGKQIQKSKIEAIKMTLCPIDLGSLSIAIDKKTATALAGKKRDSL